MTFEECYGYCFKTKTRMEWVRKLAAVEDGMSSKVSCGLCYILVDVQDADGHVTKHLEVAKTPTVREMLGMK